MANNISQSTAVKTTRAGLILCGVIGILLTVFGMLPALGEYVVHAALNFNRGLLPPLIAAFVAPGFMLIVCWYLFTNSDKIAQS